MLITDQFMEDIHTSLRTEYSETEVTDMLNKAQFSVRDDSVRVTYDNGNCDVFKKVTRLEFSYAAD